MVKACLKHLHPSRKVCPQWHPPLEEQLEPISPVLVAIRQQDEAKAELAADLVRFLGTAQSVEEYVSPSGYRFKKVTHQREDMQP